MAQLQRCRISKIEGTLEVLRKKFLVLVHLWARGEFFYLVDEKQAEDRPVNGKLRVKGQ